MKPSNTKKRAKRATSSQKVFPEEKLPLIENEPVEVRQLRRLKSRLGIFDKHWGLSGRPASGRPLSGRPALTDDELSRWLRSCDNNVIQAAAHVFRNWEFRRKWGLDTILCDYTPPPALCDNYPGGVCGVDREGSPVSYELLGRLDLASLLTSHTRDQLVKFKLWQYEVIRAELKKRSSVKGSAVGDFLLVVDLRDLHIRHFWGPGLTFWVEILEILQSHYPEMVKEIVMINPNGLYPDLYLQLRPYLGPRLRNKVSVLGVNFLRHLLLRIEKHELPAWLGGYHCDSDGDEMCQSAINWRCRENYGKGKKREDSSTPSELRTVRVLGGCRRVEEHHVTVPGSLLRWHVQEMNHGFVLAVYRGVLGDNKMLVKEVIITPASRRRYNFVTLRLPGRYFMVIDNRQNMAATLELAVRLAVEVPATLANKLQPQAPIGDSVDFADRMSLQELKQQKVRYLQGPHWRWLEGEDKTMLKRSSILIA